MIPQAVIFDVYHTLLSVEPKPTTDATIAASWANLCCNHFHEPPRLEWTEFNALCHSQIAALHTQARENGIAYPEILWSQIIANVLPEWRRLPPQEQDAFILQQIHLLWTVTLNPGAAPTLRFLQQHGIHLGILSNAQPYTLQELADALESDGLSMTLFDPTLRFWSFENGFGKPDPYCFRTLSQRLLIQGIPPGQTLMVGDRIDNDIEPAKRAGWQTWQLTHEASTDTSPLGTGNWEQLLQWLGEINSGEK
jgi:FMN phosphatase YigB (HAD superfamily)